MDDRKGTWEAGDLEIVKIVYKGKEVTKEEYEEILKGERNHEIHR